MGFVIAVLVMTIAVVIGILVWQAAKRRAMSSAVDRLTDFKATQRIMGEDGNTGLAVDENRRRVCLIRNSSDGVDCRVVQYSELISSEIIENGTSITKTSRSSQVGGVIVGGLLFGGVGAVLGGLSGSKATKTKVKQLALRMVISDTRCPTHQIDFLTAECTKGGLVYNAAMSKVSHWHGLIEAAIRRVDSKQGSSQSQRGLDQTSVT